MDEIGSGAQSLRAALFVDFDNIFISFENLDPEASRRFATQPGRWLAWFEKGAHACLEGAVPQPRRILVRRCYLNPLQFGRFRGDFTRAAFSVVDCPPLTSRGKTSTDIYMVMDALDALDHPTRFDEFIILSSDADFTPVLLRLRAHDRRSTILCTDLAAAAYKAACDWIVPHDTFFTDALGIEERSPLTPASAPSAPNDWEDMLPEVARVLREEVFTHGILPGRDLPPLFQRFPEFRNSSWFGYFSLKALTSRLVEITPEIAFTGDLQGEWSLVPKGRNGFTAEIADIKGRGELPSSQGAEGPDGEETSEELASFIRRIADLTGVPGLPPGDYAALYEAIADAVAESYGNLADLVRAVRDRCMAKGVSVSRTQVNFLLTGFRYHGYEIEGRTVEDLAHEWCRNVRTLCESAQLELTPAGMVMLEEWLLSERAAGDRKVDGQRSENDAPVTQP